jgi:hypothetical protein
MNMETRVAELERATHAMAAHYWRFQGRINAVEMLLTLMLAMEAQERVGQPFITQFVANARAALDRLMPDVDDPAKADQLRAETRTAAEEFLEQLLLTTSPGPKA